MVETEDLIGRFGGLSGKIIEIYNPNSGINIATDPNIDIGTIINDDYDPMFAIVEVIRSGISENNRRYSNSTVQQIGTLINGVHGYLGHKDPLKSHFEFRDPQNIYVGSKLEELPDGSVRLLGKSYIFKNSKLREWIPKSIAARKPLTVSIYGDGKVMRNTDGTLDVISMDKLESIDWANPGTQGMSTSKTVAVVSELTDQNLEGGIRQMERQEIVSGVTITEIKAFNPKLINSAIATVTIAELKESNSALYESIIESAKITEIKLNVDGAEKIVALTDVQEVINSKDATIAEMIQKENVTKLEVFKTVKLAEMVDEKYRDKVSKRVTGTTEQEIETSIKAESDYIAEMIGATNVNPATGSSQTTLKDFDTVANSVKSLFGGSSK